MTSLFGWCLPEMTEQDHNKCMDNFKFHDTTVECSCSCHNRTQQEETVDEVTTSSRAYSEGLETKQELDTAEVV
jgi:hypothetical protein